MPRQPTNSFVCLWAASAVTAVVGPSLRSGAWWGRPVVRCKSLEDRIVAKVQALPTQSGHPIRDGNVRARCGRIMSLRISRARAHANLCSVRARQRRSTALGEARLRHCCQHRPIITWHKDCRHQLEPAWRSSSSAHNATSPIPISGRPGSTIMSGRGWENRNRRAPACLGRSEHR